MKLVVEKEDLEVLESKSTDKVRMAGVVPPPEANGATIIFHCMEDDTILIGQEGKWLVEDNIPHYFAADEDIVTTCLDPTGKNREQLTIEAIPLIRQQITNFITHHVNNNTPSIRFDLNIIPKLTDSNQIIYPLVTKDSRDCLLPNGAIHPLLQRYFSYVTKHKEIGNRVYGFPKGGRKKLRGAYTESVLDCARRELYEEIGNIGAGGEGIRAGGVSIDNADFVGYDGTEINKYAVYYKRITLAEKQIIENVITLRKRLSIGESFDLMFIPRVNLDRLRLNTHSINSKEFVQAPPAKAQMTNKEKALNLQARGKFVPPPLRKYLSGGAKKTRRRHRKRRTTSKRR
jgi:hypothetical protein